MKTLTIIRGDFVKYAIPCNDEGELLDNDVVSLPKGIRLKAGDKICIVEW
jgi:hypothetical protein